MNAFIALAERQMTAPIKRRVAAAEARHMDKAEHDRATLSKLYIDRKDAQLNALRNGVSGHHIVAIEQMLGSATMGSITTLVDVVRSADWLRGADLDTRAAVLSLVAAAIARVREEAGLPPFDDGLPDEAPTSFVLVREMLR